MWTLVWLPNLMPHIHARPFRNTQQGIMPATYIFERFAVVPSVVETRIQHVYMHLMYDLIVTHKWGS